MDNYEQILPNILPDEYTVNGTFWDGKKTRTESTRVTEAPRAPAYMPPWNKLSWQSIPQGWEALRYAQAVADRPPTLSPPRMLPIRDEVARAQGMEGLADVEGIGMTNRAFNASAFPYVLPPSVTPQMANLSGVLPHELTHYLARHAARRENMLPGAWAERAFKKLPPYKPMFAVPSSNQNQNYEEQLANRVALPYVDAQMVGQRAAPMLQQAAPVSILPSWMLKQFNNAS